jgi:hypothetical protein
MKQASKDNVKTVQRWATHPLEWIEEVFSDAIASGEMSITRQQRKAWKELGVMISAKLKLETGEVMTQTEKAYSRKFGISIQSGNGCHAKGTKILLHDGMVKNVEDIVVGDVLIDDSGTPTMVTSLARGRQRMYRIQYAFGDYYDVNEDHILSLVATGTKGKRTTGDKVDVCLKDYLLWGKDKKRCHSFYKAGVDVFKDTKPLPLDPYIFGVWLGDGNQNTSSFYGIDSEISDALIAHFHDYRYVNRIVKEHHFQLVRKRSGKNPFAELLKEHNLFKNKHIPHIYKTASRGQRLRLLAGILDTDGHLDKRNKRVFTVIQKREALANDIVFLARSLGFHATITAKDKSWTWKGIKKTCVYHEVSISRGPLHEIPTLLKRKQAAVPKDIAKKIHFNFTVTKLKVDDYYGFSLSGNGRFLGADFTVLHNTGKDFWASITILFFLACFPEPKVPCTANSARQLRNVLWSEISKWMRKANRIIPGDLSSPTILEHLFEWQAEKIYNKEYEGRTWFAEAVTINTKATDTEQAEAIAGRHERFMLIVVDEASGIAPAVFNKFESTMTQPVNIMVLIYNPTREKGYAVDSQHSEHWVAMRWNAEDSERVDKEHIKRIEEKYGRESNPYRIRVLGLPPLSDSDTLIPYDWIMDAVDRDIKEINPITIKGVDVGAGGDKSVILTRVGGTISKITRSNTRDTMMLVERVSMEIFEDSPHAVLIDNIGIGKGVYDALNAKHRNVKAVDVRRTARNEQRFVRLRDELWWKARDMFEAGNISIPNDTELIDQLSSVKWSEQNGRIKVQGKKEMKAHGKDSPDEADALCLTFHYRDDTFRKDEEIDPYEDASDIKPRSWMGM